MRRWWTTRACLAVFVVLVLGVLAQVDSLQYRRQLPRTLRYIPPGARLQLLFPNLQASWEALSEHRAPEFLPRTEDDSWYDDRELGPLGHAYRDKMDDLTAEAASKCLFFDNVVPWDSYGIDPNGAVVVALSAMGDEPDGLVVVSLTDITKFAALLATGESLTADVELHPADANGRSPAEYVVRRLGDSDYGRLCAPAHHSVIGDTDVKLFDNRPLLTFVPNPFAAGQFRLACTVIYDDGTSGDCACQWAGKNTGTQDCAKAVDVKRQTRIWNRYRPVAQRRAGRRVLAVDPFNVTFPDDNTAIFASRPALLDAALRNPKRNMSAQFNSRLMRDAVQHLRHPPFGSTNILFGFVQSSLPFQLGNTSFAIHADARRLQGTFKIIAPTLGLTFLERLIAPPEAKAPSIPIPADSSAGLTVAHEHASYLLESVTKYVEGSRAHLARYLGNFDVVVDTLLAHHSFTALGLHVLESREGLPLTALAVRVDGDATANSLIRRLRRKLKVARDITILTNAATKYCAHGRRTPTVAALLADEHLVLTNERPETWHHYRLAAIPPACGGKPTDQPLFVLEADFTEATFAGETYHTTIDGREIQFVMPKVTTNDFAHRWQTGELPTEARQRALGDVNRMAVHYAPGSRILWFAVDGPAVRRALYQSQTTSRHLASDPNVGPTIAQFHLHPAWWMTHGHNHPVRAVRDVLENSLDLVRYDTVRVSATTEERSNAISGTVSLSR